MSVKQTNRAFGFTFAGVFAVISAVGYVVFHHLLTWAMGLSGLFLLLALAVPAVLLPLNRLWAILAGKIGAFNNKVVLGAFFYAILSPVGSLMRLLGGDPMRRRPDPAAASYFSPVGRQADAETYQDLF